MPQLGHLHRSGMTEVEDVEDDQARPDGEEIAQRHRLLEGPAQPERRCGVAYVEWSHGGDLIGQATGGAPESGGTP